MPIIARGGCAGVTRGTWVTWEDGSGRRCECVHSFEVGVNFDSEGRTDFRFYFKTLEGAEKAYEGLSAFEDRRLREVIRRPIPSIEGRRFQVIPV